MVSARNRFAVQGFELASVDNIAMDCGRTKGSVYHHFESKESLFESVFAIEQRRIADSIVDTAASGDPVVSLQDGVRAYLMLVSSDAAAARITLIDAPGVLGWQQWRACDDGPFRALLHVAIDSIETAGRLRQGYDPELLTELLLGSITEAALSIATSKDSAKALGFAESISQLIAHITRE